MWLRYSPLGSRKYNFSYFIFAYSYLHFCIPSFLVISAILFLPWVLNASLHILFTITDVLFVSLRICFLERVSCFLYL